MRDDVAFWCVWCHLSRAAPAHLRAARHLLYLLSSASVAMVRPCAKRSEPAMWQSNK